MKETEKFFVVGSSAKGSASSTWNCYSNAEKIAKYSRFVNFPQRLVRLIDPQRSVIRPFFSFTGTSLQGDKTPQIVFGWFISLTSMTLSCLQTSSVLYCLPAAEMPCIDDINWTFRLTTRSGFLTRSSKLLRFHQQATETKCCRWTGHRTFSMSSNNLNTFRRTRSTMSFLCLSTDAVGLLLCDLQEVTITGKERRTRAC